VGAASNIASVGKSGSLPAYNNNNGSKEGTVVGSMVMVVV